MSSTPVLLDIGSRAYAHQADVDSVKAQLGITHSYFDCWIYGFLENKNFNVDEAVAKLRRRDVFEKTELAAYEMTEWMYENMQRGIIQVIGNDKQGRVTFYIVTARDKPQASRRDESRRTFDMFVSYGTRLRPESKRCQMAMLINQDKASMWGNLDMTFQAEIALRIAKYYPGAIDKMYICNMGRTLSAFAKPIFSRLPSIVSDRIQIVTEADIKNGALLEYYDAAVLPVALGGRNACDRPENYTQFANVIRDYFADLQRAVRRGCGVKEWELDTLRAAGYIAEDVSHMDMLRRTMTVAGGGRSSSSSVVVSGGEDGGDGDDAAAAAAAMTGDGDGEQAAGGELSPRSQPSPHAAEDVAKATSMLTTTHVDALSSHSVDHDGDAGMLSTYSAASAAAAADAHAVAMAAAAAATKRTATVTTTTAARPRRGSSDTTATTTMTATSAQTAAPASAALVSPARESSASLHRRPGGRHAHDGGSHNNNNNNDDDDDDTADLFTCDTYVAGEVTDATRHAMQWPPPPPASPAVASVATTATAAADLMRSLRLSARARSEVGSFAAAAAATTTTAAAAAARHGGGGSVCNDGGSGSRYDDGNNNKSGSGDWFADYVVQFATLEAFFRLNVQEMHAREWLQLVRDEMDERRQLLRAADEVHGERLLRGLPPSLYAIAKGFLWMCSMVMAVYFLASTLFLALLGVTTLVYLFFAMFTSPYNVFLYGTALVVTAGQFVVCCSRGFDVTRNTYHCRLVQALRALGNRAHMCQIAVSVICVLVCFVVFCVSASRHGVLTGVQYSVTIGWLISACIIVLYHFVFAFGLRTITTPSYAHGSRVNHAETTLYLFMNVDLDDEQLRSRSSAEVLVPSMLAAVSFAAGMAYLCGAGVFFLAAMLVVQSALLLLCAVVLCMNNASSSSSLVVCGVCYATVFWLDAVFTMARYGWATPWSNSLLAVLFVMLFFLVLGFVAMYCPWKARAVRSWLFRLTWLVVLVHFAACVIALLVHNYRLGLFVLALGVHLVLTNFRVNESANTYGLFAISFGVLVALLTCCLLGKYAYEERYSGSLAPSTSSSGSGNTLAFLSRHTAATTTTTTAATSAAAVVGAHDGDNDSSRVLTTVAGQLAQRLYASTPLPAMLSMLPPICLARFPLTSSDSSSSSSNNNDDDRSLSVLAMALLAKIGYNTDVDAQRRDVQRWLPAFDTLYTVPATRWGAVDVTVFSSSSNNGNSNSSNNSQSSATPLPVTVLAVRPSANVQAVMEAMTMWLEGYTVAVFSALVPEQYSMAMAAALSFMRDMVPLLWRSHTVDGMTRLLSSYVLDTTAHEEQTTTTTTTTTTLAPSSRDGPVYVVGSGPSGTMAALITARLLATAASSSTTATAGHAQPPRPRRLVRAVVFAPTQVLHTSLLGGVDEVALAQQALFVNTRYSLYDPMFKVAAYTQILPCDASNGACDRLDTTLRTLFDLCARNDTGDSGSSSSTRVTTTTSDV